jgi:hypothetical protein
MTKIFLQGTAFIVGDSDNVRKLYAQIPGSRLVEHGLYTVPCDADIPPVSFHIGGRKFPLTRFIFTKQRQGSTRCYGALQEEWDPEMEGWTLGVAFMRNYYIVFDVGRAQVGFATLR